MKELSIEEKAKRFDEAVINGSRLWECGAITREKYEYIFPELTESDDERIELLNYLYDSHDDDEERARWIAWLEKQGEKKSYASKTMNEKGDFDSGFTKMMENEQKPADKVEPKFHKGDWVVYEFTGSVYQIKNCIENVSNHKYGYDLTNGGYIGSDEVYHLWTIRDAKDGDVLAAHECYVIFKEIDGWNIKCYCTYHYLGFNPSFYVDTLQNKNAFHPATIEQRDLLFQKMKEEGYEWDAEKKELKKIEQKTWSEEDETTKNNISHIIRQYDKISKRENQPCCYVGDCLLWMQNIRDRVQPQHKQGGE